MVPWYISELNMFIKNAVNHIVVVRPSSTVEGRVWQEGSCCVPWTVSGFLHAGHEIVVITAEKFLELRYTFQIQTKLDYVLSRNIQKKRKRKLSKVGLCF